MKVWTCTGFEGFYPVGTAAIVVADSEEQACELLEFQLASEGLSQQITPEDLKPVILKMPNAIILCNGNY